MLKAKDFRREAWTKLSGKWGTLALVTLIYLLITGACSAMAYIGIGAIAALLISGPLTLGFAIISLKVIRMQEIKLEMLFAGFNDFVRAFVLSLINGIFIFLWSLLLIIPGIIKAFSYSMSFYILADNKELSANEARKRSMEMMKGNKWRLFCLGFSFIGWHLLCILTLGILYFWITPYLNASEAAFYQSLLPAAPQEETLQIEQ